MSDSLTMVFAFPEPNLLLIAILLLSLIQGLRSMVRFQVFNSVP